MYPLSSTADNEKLESEWSGIFEYYFLTLD